MFHLNNKNIAIKIFLISVILLILINSICFAVVNPTEDFYVDDYAKLLDNDTKEYIIKINKELYSKTGVQIVVVTVPTIGNNSIEEYANTLFNNWGIGSKQKNNGVLMLLSLQERKFRIEVGYGLEGALPDGKTGRIQDEYMIPHLKKNEWDEGIKNGFNAILDVILKEYDINIDNAQYAQKVSNIGSIDDDTLVLTIIAFMTIIPMFSLIAGIVVAKITINNKKRKKKILNKEERKKKNKRIGIIIVLIGILSIILPIYFHILEGMILYTVLFIGINLTLFGLGLISGSSNYNSYSGGFFDGGGSSFGGGYSCVGGSSGGGVSTTSF